ncbi:MAG: OsmC family protein, partial [Gemmatimonadota bacterium]
GTAVAITGSGSAPDSEEGRTVARLTGGGFRTDVMAGGHGLVADEPESVGGTDQGPSPYDLVNAALGACTAMTLRMYADRKEWPLEEVTVRVDHDKVHADDCEACDDADAGDRSKIDRFEREVSVTGELDDEQRERLLEIADRCPVSRTLKASSAVVNRLAEE